MEKEGDAVNNKLKPQAISHESQTRKEIYKNQKQKHKPIIIESQPKSREKSKIKQTNNRQKKDSTRMMGGGGGGTEAFPELGGHCQNPDCKQLDFLPFKCDGCSKMYCLEHRTYKSHECPKSEHKSRRVVVCQICSISIEVVNTGKENKEFKEEEKMILERHEKSGDCDPSSKKKKPRCSVKRCKEILTFSNTSTCRICQVKVCLGHRFPSDHDCKKRVSSVGSSSNGVGGGGLGNKFLAALVGRNAKACGSKMNNSIASSSSSSSVKAN